MRNNLAMRRLLKYFYYILIVIVGMVYFATLITLVYIGPLETILVKQKLKNNPVDIIVSFTTTPYRVDQIKPVLESIARQSIKPTRIYVNIPWRFKRDNTEYVLPTWLTSDPNIIINRTEDYGPATKLIATLEKEHNPNTIIITFDDDRTYSKHTVRDLVKQYLTSSYEKTYKVGAAFTGFGLNLLFAPKHNMYVEPIILDHKPSLVVVGTGGVAYRRDFFKNDIFSLIKSLPLTCFLGDDLMISAYLLYHGIDIIKISGMSYNPLFITSLFLKELPSASTRDALSVGANGVASGSNEANYCRCLDFLLENNKAEFRNVILARSKLIHGSFIPDNFHISMVQLCYYYLEKLVEFFPFIKQMILVTMG